MEGIDEKIEIFEKPQQPKVGEEADEEKLLSSLDRRATLNK